MASWAIFAKPWAGACYRSPRFRLGVFVAAGATVGLWGWGFLPHRDQLPDFSTVEDTDAKKAAFFTFLEPHIEAINRDIRANRTRLISIRAACAQGDAPGWLDRRWLNPLLERYEIDPPDEIDLVVLDQLLRRVDAIPPSLILAQAANESAWGTSRFARQGNNLFGMRTYTPGAGMVPRRRPRGATWEVASYPSVRDGLAAYIHTLNTHPSYRYLRSIRRDLRQADRTVNGMALAAGLTRYSERGSEYVSIIRSIISGNELQHYDG